MKSETHSPSQQRIVKCNALPICGLAALSFAASAFAPACGGETVGLYSGWRFHRGDIAGAESPDFRDSSWEVVSVPHDWAISGPFDITNDIQRVAIRQDGETKERVRTGRTGALPWIGAGWYRRELAIPANTEHAELEFDGAMSDSRVYVDGRLAGGRPNGYVPFTVDISDFVAGIPTGSVHIVAVRLENMPRSARWYPGAGLIRPVRLATGPRTGLAAWGTYVRTTALLDGEARVAVSDEIRNQSGKLSVRWRILEDGGREAATAEGEVSGGIADGVLVVASPRLWSGDSPALYWIESELLDAKGGRADLRRTRFGIRTVALSGKGFLLNGKRVDFKGVCLHHDLGSIGAAFNPSAFRRQVRMMKEMGANAIRTSHNAPCADQIAICDEAGMMVMAESFDEWETPKCANGYNRFFKEWWERDLSNIVRRFRSSPSIVMWSIGNEIWEDDIRKVASYGRMLQDTCHLLDPTRPVTQCVDRPDGAVRSGALQLMDVPGLNYRLPKYALAHAVSRTGLVLGSETASTLSSRGEYLFPVKTGARMQHANMQCSSYDIECCEWSNLPDDDWAMQESAPWSIGEFVWTGFDYLGEPTPYGTAELWPSRSAYFGTVDLAGIPKDRFWLYRSHWNAAEETLHILPHWTWPGMEGKNIPVYVYTSFQSAELFVNGVSQGRRTKDPATRLDRYRLRWNDVKYAPGELRVVAYGKDGAKAAEKTVRTAGAPTRLELEPEMAAIRATPSAEGMALVPPELGYIRARIVDAGGNVCPWASNRVDFAVSGAARFKGVCNGDATSLETFTHPAMRAFHGELVLTVEAGSAPGPVRIEASSKGLSSGSVEISVLK